MLVDFGFVPLFVSQYESGMVLSLYWQDTDRVLFPSLHDEYSQSFHWVSSSLGENNPHTHSWVSIGLMEDVSHAVGSSCPSL